MAEFVAGGEHRRSLRQQDRGQQRPTEAGAQRQHRRLVGVALDPVIAAQVVGVAVAVVLAIGLVVPMPVAEQVAQREAIVRDDIVDRVGRRAVAMMEHIG